MWHTSNRKRAVKRNNVCIVECKFIRRVSGGNINIPGDYSIDLSRQKSVYVSISYSRQFLSYLRYSSKIVDKEEILRTVSNN
jgi:hypothetical protein